MYGSIAKNDREIAIQSRSVLEILSDGSTDGGSVAVSFKFPLKWQAMT